MMGRRGSLIVCGYLVTLALLAPISAADDGGDPDAEACPPVIIGVDVRPGIPPQVTPIFALQLWCIGLP